MASKATHAPKQQALVPAEAKSGLPADYSAYEEFAGQGLEDVTSEDKGLPFFEILQPLSPELEEVPGAAAGKIINKATKETFDEIVFIPACRQHVYTEWVPRDSGGGLVATHELSSQLVQTARAKQRVGKFVMENGHELIETFYLYGLVLDAAGEATPAVISFTSTKISAYKTLTTRADALMFKTPDGRKLKFPWFAHKWRLTTEKKKKDKYTWWTWNVAFDGKNNRAEEARLPADHPAVIMGSEIVASMRAGALKVNTEGLRNETSGGDSSDNSDAGDPPF